MDQDRGAARMLTGLLESALRPLVDGGRYALIDYPLYHNPGDAAIWLGTRQILGGLFGTAPAYTATLRGFDPDTCRRRIGGGTVFLLGGGNFGGLYSRHHDMRLRVIAAMAGNRIVQLPFSVAGLDEALEPTRKVLAAHGNVTLIAREAHSQAVVARLLGERPLLAPDAAHGLRLPVGAPIRDETRLLRRDREAAASGTRIDAGDSWDWADLPRLRWLNRAGKAALALAPAAAAPALRDRLARAKVETAAARLAEGQTVVTDRLHGAILASVIGRKTVVRDNATGKVAAYLQTWGKGLPSCRLDG
ncbi:pyruvyl transferase EpsO [Cereibacter ovatus]|uniref:Pyruvyl transferase EpsO n=1 Tax=Cereibacter ovatus TaxID=439529 RepID=A0A285CU73_9RHOB|nr:polysaccharide pyruvyl transferase family protein [Cereibacter ovatus]SNX71120.1 pyruvyl transferase EpsO [Cereibacter ovatus]